MKALIASLLIGVAGATGPLRHEPAGAPPHAPRPIPRLLCESPPTLRLVRFEDGSGRLECGERVLVRIAVPW